MPSNVTCKFHNCEDTAGHAAQEARNKNPRSVLAACRELIRNTETAPKDGMQDSLDHGHAYTMP
jgi:hypothetical protein